MTRRRALALGAIASTVAAGSAAAPAAAQGLTATDDRINVKHPPPPLVPAMGNGTTDDRPALQAMIDALPATGGELYFPPDSGNGYLIGGGIPLKVLKNGVTLRGPGASAATLVSASGDVLQFGDSTRDVFHSRLDGIGIQSNPGGGHCVVSAKGISMGTVRDVRIKQHNAGKNLWRHPGGGPMIDMHWTGCEFEHTAAATVPGFYLLTSRPNEGVNRNTWDNLRCTYSGEYFFHLECAVASTYNFDNAFRDINMEIPTGGVLKLLSAQGTVVENVNTYDLTSATTRDLIFIGKSATGPRSVRNDLRSVNRRGGTLGTGNADIRVDDAYYTTIANSDNATGALFAIELNHNPYVTLENLGDGVTLRNIGAYTTQTWGYGRLHVPEGLVSKTKAGPVSDADFTYPPPSGTGPVIDTLNNRAYFKVGSAWRYTTLT